MLKSLKARSVAVILASAICGSSLMVPKADAIVAIAAWNPPLMGLGLAVASGGILAGEGLGSLAQWSTGSDIFGEGVGIFFGIIGAAGMIILDGKTAQQLAFTTITTDQARKLGISKAETDSFNGEIDRVNAIASQVGDELVRMNHPTLQDSKAAWETYRDLVSPETFSAMQKIAAQFAKKRN